MQKIFETFPMLVYCPNIDWLEAVARVMCGCVCVCICVYIYMYVCIYIYITFYGFNAVEWDCGTVLIYLLLIWQSSSAVTQLSCNLTGASKKTRIWVRREETWVQAQFIPLVCFKTWNLLFFP